MNDLTQKPKWDFRLDVVSAHFNKFTCNYRCPFCHKDYFLQAVPPKEEKHPLSYGIELCRNFLKGPYSIHLSGSGEPLNIPHQQFKEIILPLTKLENCTSISLTTNGYNLIDYLDDIRQLGICDVNVSIPCLNVQKYHELMRVSYDRAKDIIERTKNGIIAARAKGISVDLNVCVSYNIIDYIEDFFKFSRENDITLKFFPIISVPDLNVTSNSNFFSDLLIFLTKLSNPTIEAAGRYITVKWNIDGAKLSAKPGDAYIRPYECYNCAEFMRCEEACWKSVRISPWYIQPCGIKKDNIYWYKENDLDHLRESLTDGGKITGSILNHFEYKEKMAEVINDDSKRNYPFIVIEGPDGSGKTKIVEELSKKLGFINYKTPPRIFQKIDIMTELEQAGLEFARYLFYMSSDYYANLEVCSLLLYSGIVCDRWVLSTNLYHEVALGFSVPLPEKLKIELIKPDLTIILEVSDEIQANRLSSRPDTIDAKWEKNNPLRKIISDKYHGILDDKTVHINNEGTIDETIEKCLSAIDSYGIKYKK